MYKCGASSNSLFWFKYVFTSIHLAMYFVRYLNIPLRRCQVLSWDLDREYCSAVRCCWTLFSRLSPLLVRHHSFQAVLLHKIRPLFALWNQEEIQSHSSERQENQIIFILFGWIHFLGRGLSNRFPYFSIIFPARQGSSYRQLFCHFYPLPPLRRPNRPRSNVPFLVLDLVLLFRYALVGTWLARAISISFASFPEPPSSIISYSSEWWISWIHWWGIDTQHHICPNFKFPVALLYAVSWQFLEFPDLGSTIPNVLSTQEAILLMSILTPESGFLIVQAPSFFL